MKYEIILSGVGGQGLISIGDIIGNAAVFEGKNAALTSVYGSEARGTFTKADVIVSDENIHFPGIESPGFILCLAQVAYQQYLGQLTGDSIVFYDSNQVTTDPAAKGRHIGHDFRQLGIELGNIAVANTIALGSIVSVVNMLRPESVVSAITERFAGRQSIIDLNIRAFELGMSLK